MLILSFSQDDTAFEKQSALFALAVSDIVLINMWVFPLFFIETSFQDWANFRKFEICLATCTSCFDVFQVESSFFTQLNFFCLQCLWRWCHDIGREQAANKPLLKTVFQVSFASNLLTASSYLESQNLLLIWLCAFRLWWDCLVRAKQHCYLSYVIKQGCVRKKVSYCFFLIILICCWCD
jgi:hypothetical protein